MNVFISSGKPGGSNNGSCTPPSRSRRTRWQARPGAWQHRRKSDFFCFDSFIKKFSVCVCSPPGYGKLEAHERAGGQGEDEGAVVALVAPRHELIP